MSEDMKKIFEDYDKLPVPVGGFSKEQLNSSEKVKLLVNIIKLSEINLKKRAEGIFDEFNVNFVYTSSDNSKLNDGLINAFSTEFDDSKKDLTVSINFNFSNLAQLGSAEAYSVVSAIMYKSLLKKREMLSDSNKVKFGKEEDLLAQEQENESVVNDDGFDREGNFIRTSHPIRDYLIKIIKKILGEDVQEYDCEQTAKFVESDFVAEDIQPEDLFENPNGENLLAERYGKVVKQGYTQQATYLLGEISKDEFNSLKNGSDAEIKTFCSKYVKCILANSNISEKDVAITFKNEGYLGEYLDYGNRQEININLQKIKQKNNPAEVVMTLQHELTHAIDSTINKSQGLTENGGYGLLDNLVGGSRENLNKVRANNPQNQEMLEDYFIRLQEICYRVNPNECSARMGELTAINFMKNLNTDKSMQTYIDKSVESYNKYQSKVLSAIENIDVIIKEFDSIQDMADEKTENLIKERIRYLRMLQKTGRINPNSIKYAMEIASGKLSESSDLSKNQGSASFEMGA